ncbi:putative domain SAYSvFN [Dillenia turbinata]|uniref:Domain SAYSvFN n=1 Tax=Dillenia turbinata TaxID=194707 RepID=A0AAN8ZEP0_9MAGN
MGGESKEIREEDEELVQIILKTIGPFSPSTLNVPSHIKLRKLIAEIRQLPIGNLKLILKGSTLVDNKYGDDVYVQLSNGAMKPRPPAKHLRDGLDDDDDEDLMFQLPQSASWWKRRIYAFMHDKMKLPEIMLMAIFSLSLRAWAIAVMWFALAPLAHKYDLGPLYILGTGFSIILLNLGQRQHGDMSAYSIFNEGFRELPGTLNADQIDRDLRTGQF